MKGMATRLEKELMKQGYETVVIDPSHAAGDRALVPSLSLAAVAAGADGVIIEVHPDPDKAVSDGAQSMTLPAFEALVAEGLAMQHRSQTLAQQHLTDVAQRLGEMTARAGDATSGRWDRLGGIFEDRVAQALLKLGTPSAQDWSEVLQRLEALEKSAQAAPAAPQAPKQAPTRRTKAPR